ncbi:MAG: inosine 5-monophosphate dehydrogenase [Chloroflexi bacterium RBG_16_57_8]|nr:MAG: inosine 5-monophosphate dehydrogenase [Chloroflexi bacterium RBG_16_57_8]
MAKVFDEISRTFDEYLLIPNLTTRDCTPSKVSLTTSLSRHRESEAPLRLNIPIVSAIMQSVSNHALAIELSKSGGMSFIFCSQPIGRQVDMVRKVKSYKAGFVTSDSNLEPDNTLADLLKLKEKTGHSTVAVTDDGEPDGRLLGIITSKDYRVTRDPLDKKVSDFMTPFSRLVYGKTGTTLTEANDILWKSKIDCLPIVNDRGNLVYLVFRKDYVEHKENEGELLDNEKRLLVGAGVNTWDYSERVPALVEAGADILCIDSSHGYTEWQSDTLKYVKDKYGDSVKAGAGNIVDPEGFLYLTKAGADFVKVGIGGGSICITREQRAIGRGQATAILDVAKARDRYLEETGTYVPICSDGGISHDHQIALALAMGADFVMLGRYFARFDESPSKKIVEGNQYLKEYWGEGTNKAQNWQRYDLGDGKNALLFEEGVDGYVPYAGKLKDNLEITLAKIRAAMSACGAASIKEFQQNARLTVVSSRTIQEGGVHDVITKET